MNAPMPGMPPEKKKGSNACLWACGGCLGCGGLLVLVLGIVCYTFYNKAMPSTPLPPSDFVATAEERDSVQKRLDAVKPKMEAGEEIRFTLTEREANALGEIARKGSPQIRALDAKINGDTIAFRFSIGEGGRFLNLVFRGRVNLTPEHCQITAEELNIGEMHIMEYVNTNDAASKQQLDQQVEQQLRVQLARLRIEQGIDLREFSVKDGKLHLIFRKESVRQKPVAPAKSASGSRGEAR